MQILIKFENATIMVKGGKEQTIQEFLNCIKFQFQKKIIGKKKELIGFELNGIKLEPNILLGSVLSDYTEIVPLISNRTQSSSKKCKKMKKQKLVESKNDDDVFMDTKEKIISIQFLDKDPVTINKLEITTIASLCKRIANIQNIPIPIEDSPHLFDVPGDFCSCNNVSNNIKLQNYIGEEVKNFQCAICRNDAFKCIVCEELLDNNDCPLTQLSCKDIFHLHCCQRWVRTNQSCPLCSTFITSQENETNIIRVFHNKQIIELSNKYQTREDIITQLPPLYLQTLMIHHPNGTSSFLRNQTTISSMDCITVCGMKAHPEFLDLNVEFESKIYKIATLSTISTFDNIKKEMQRLTKQSNLDIFFNNELQHGDRCLGELDQIQLTFFAKIGNPILTLDLFSAYCKISLPCSFYDETIIEDLDEFQLFGVWRPLLSSLSSQDVVDKNETDNWLKHFAIQNDWNTNTIPEQTVKGWNILLSTLIVTANTLSKTANSYHIFLQFFDFFPPLKIAMLIFIQKMQTMMGPAEKAVFTQGIYFFLQKYVPVTTPLNTIFEHARVVFAYLFQYMLSQQQEKPGLDIISCPFHMLDNHTTTMQEKTNYKIANIEILVMHIYKHEKKTQHNEENVVVVPPPWATIMKQSRECRSLSIYNANQFRFAPNPCLTLNKQNELSVFTGWEPCSADITLFSPSLGRVEMMDPSKLSQSLNLEFDLNDDRIPIEGLMVCFDISKSMDSASGFDVVVKDKAQINQDYKTYQKTIWQSSRVHLRIYGPLTERCDCLLTQIISNKQTLRILHSTQSTLQYHTKRTILKQWTHLMEDEERKMISMHCETFINYIFTNTMKKMAHSETDNHHVEIETPKIFICPITMTIMQDPFIAFDNFTYERSAIEEWLKKNNTSPMTRAENVDNLPLRPNLSLRSEIKSFNIKSSEESKFITIKITNNNSTWLKFTEPYNITVNELKMLIWDRRYKKPSTFSLWANLKDVGDGHSVGSVLNEPRCKVNQYINEKGKVKLEMGEFHRKKKSFENNSSSSACLSRLETVKQLFHSFINKSVAYDYPIHIGLQTFGNDVELKCGLTPFYENFRDTIDSIEAKGNTALFECISQATQRLLVWKELHPNANLRILCLSDGQDHSKFDKDGKGGLLQICRDLQKHKIILDVVQIGNDIDTHLRGMSYLSSGFFFKPESLANAMKLNELETFLCVQDREEKKLKYHEKIHIGSTLHKLRFEYGSIIPDQCNDEKVPTRKNPIDLDKASTNIQTSINSHNNNQNSGTKSIMKALLNVQKEAHPAWDIFPCTENIYFWKLILQGPTGSIYENGCWLLFAKFPLDYPQSAPEIRFVTPIKHANVNVYGKICHSIFNRNYNQFTTMSKILSVVYSLLLSPDVQDPIDSTLVLEYHAGNGIYEMNVLKHVKQHASKKTREEFAIELNDKS